MVTDKSKKLQAYLTDVIHPRVRAVELVHPMEDFRIEGAIDDLRDLGSIHRATEKMVRRPWLSVLGGRVDFRIARNGSLFSLAVLPRATRFANDYESNRVCERFIRFANLCAARMWKYCHRGELVLPDKKLLLRREQLNDDAERETGLNRIIDEVEEAFKRHKFLGSVNPENRGRPAKRMTLSDFQTLNHKMDQNKIEVSEKLSSCMEELNRLHQEITKLNARLNLSVNQ